MSSCFHTIIFIGNKSNDKTLYPFHYIKHNKVDYINEKSKFVMTNEVFLSIVFFDLAVLYLMDVFSCELFSH